MNRVVLVTGGAGYIGSHCCKALARAGYLPVAYDNLVHGHEQAVRWGPLEVGDIQDRQRLDGLLAKYNPASAIHLAAWAYVGESMANPEKYYRNNVAGSLSLFDALRQHGTSKLVFSSSCATYGTPPQFPITEATPQTPINPYGMSKLMVERILADYGKAYGFQSIALRYFNAAGADPDGEIGEDHDPETHMIPLLLRAAAGLTDAFDIYGDDYPTPDGTCVRDFVHVSDIADAHVLALETLERSATDAAFNLGSGTGLSVAEAVTAARRITGRAVPVRVGPRRPGDPPVLVADASRAARRLQWKPTRSDTDTLLGSAWAWLMKSRPRDQIDRGSTG